MNKKIIDVHYGGLSCNTCNKKFKNKNIAHSYLEIIYDEDGYDEEELLFCSEKCMINYILGSENVGKYEIELYNSRDESNLKKKEEICDKITSLNEFDSININDNIKVCALNFNDNYRYLLTINNITEITTLSTQTTLLKIYKELKI
ncbi:MAG: hypothetical protein RR359_04860 [Bacilli bacterium]